MFESHVRFINGVQFEVESRGHKVVCDQPPTFGGTDAGMTPPEFLLASLGTCAGYYAAEYLKSRKLSLERLQVHVSAEKAMQPARLGSFRIEVESPSANDAKTIDGLQRAVGKCLIHATLMHAPAIEILVAEPVAH